jgi:hypothetical protein
MTRAAKGAGERVEVRRVRRSVFEETEKAIPTLSHSSAWGLQRRYFLTSLSTLHAVFCLNKYKLQLERVFFYFYTLFSNGIVVFVVALLGSPRERGGDHGAAGEGGGGSEYTEDSKGTARPKGA